MSETASIEPIGKREKTKVANRQAILVAARRVFAELGYESATVRDIIRGTELASGTFYNYFRSKEEVFEALADDGARRFRPILRMAREHAKSFEDYLRSAFIAYFRFVAEENREAGLPVDERRPHVRTDTPEMMAVYQEVRQSLEDAIAHGDLPHIDADYLAHACIGIAQELGPAMLRRSPPDIDNAAAFATGLILKGLEGAPRKN
ncbi:TetR/AcrR family transcriptional regulator [Vitreimonas sp.]|jgi:AcrR family transcriptional regulator|uniref:TetR/AcrR family transcriptional regulator n=1 Tax=Vitreimonas sp. TaxID=3069702 RepID=UPI002ED9033C